MSSPYIQGSLRVLSASSRVGGTVQIPPAAAVSWDLPDGLYDDFTTLAAAMQTAIRDATSDNGWSVTVIGTYGVYGFCLAHLGTWNVTWDGPLEEHCAFHASGVGVYLTYVSSYAPPFAWWPRWRIVDPNVYRVHHRKVRISCQARALGRLGPPDVLYEATLRPSPDTLAQFRTFLAGAIAGRPFRLWQSGGTSSAWSTSNRMGYLDLQLLEPKAAEAWLNDPSAVMGDWRLRAKVV